MVLLVMNEHGIERLLQDKVTLGADASLAAGPLGRSGAAATDAQLTAEMLSYPRARGVFAGIDLSGGSLRSDESADQAFYGHAIPARDVLFDRARVPDPPLRERSSPLLMVCRVRVPPGTARNQSLMVGAGAFPRVTHDAQSTSARGKRRFRPRRLHSWRDA